MKKLIYILFLTILPSQIVFGQKVETFLVFFDNGQALLRNESTSLLDSLAGRMTYNPTDTLFLIGHTDNIGSAKYNEKLSLYRVDAVKFYLAGKGIDSKRIKYKAYGEIKPIADNDSDEGRQRNRRVDILLKSEQKELACKFI